MSQLNLLLLKNQGKGECMFLEKFNLSINPFGMTSGLDFLYRSTAFEESMAHLIYGLDNSEAIVLITGPIGSGKTMSLQSFLTNLGNHYLFALVTNTQVTHIELLKLILDDFGISLDPNWDKSDLLIAFKNFLIKARQEGQKVIVVIDEAQNLSCDVLEEVRLLTNLGQGAEQLVQLILVGQPELKELVNKPELAQLRQRIRVHYDVETLNHEEMVGYINHRMEVAGCAKEVFKPNALKKIFKNSGGIPRLVNTIAGDALLSAFVANHSMVEVADVEDKTIEENQTHSEFNDLTPPPLRNAELSAQNLSSNKVHPDPNTGSNIIFFSFRNFKIFLALVIFFAPIIWYFVSQDSTLTTSLGQIQSPPTPRPQPITVDSTVTHIEYVPTKPIDNNYSNSILPDTEDLVKSNSFFLLVASFPDSIKAGLLLKEFENASQPGLIKKVVINNNQRYRVFLGSSPSYAAATALGEQLREGGNIKFSSIVEFKNKIGTEPAYP